MAVAGRFPIPELLVVIVLGTPSAAGPMGAIKDIVVLACGLVALIYLTNPGAGIIELIPDNVPLVGNLDEAGATLLLFSALKYFGVDFTNLFVRDPPAAVNRNR